MTNGTVEGPDDATVVIGALNELDAPGTELEAPPETAPVGDWKTSTVRLGGPEVQPK